jgi:hypothetical protein
MPGILTLPHSFADRATSIYQLTILRSQDWDDSVQLLEGAMPMRLVGKVVDLFIRPRLGHPQLIRRVSSDAAYGGEIRMTDLDRGLIRILVPRANVRADIPEGTWEFYMAVSTMDLEGSRRPVERCRGPCLVLGD